MMTPTYNRDGYNARQRRHKRRTRGNFATMGTSHEAPPEISPMGRGSLLRQFKQAAREFFRVDKITGAKARPESLK
jgi:hypothetical protein